MKRPSVALLEAPGDTEPALTRIASGRRGLTALRYKRLEPCVQFVHGTARSHVNFAAIKIKDHAA